MPTSSPDLQYTKQHEEDLHKGINGAAIPPQNTSPLTGEAAKWIEDQTHAAAHDAAHIAKTTLNPEDESTKTRFARINPISILATKMKMKKAA